MPEVSTQEIQQPTRAYLANSAREDIVTEQPVRPPQFMPIILIES